MGRLAEMQRKLLEVSRFKLFLTSVSNLFAANDGPGGHGRRERELALER